MTPDGSELKRRVTSTRRGFLRLSLGLPLASSVGVQFLLQACTNAPAQPAAATTPPSSATTGAIAVPTAPPPASTAAAVIAPTPGTTSASPTKLPTDVPQPAGQPDLPGSD